MKIIYSNYIEKDCVSHIVGENENPPTGDIIIGSRTSPKDKSSIVLFNSAEKDDQRLPIYAEFANADTVEDAKTFYKKYGALISPTRDDQPDLDTHSFHTLNTLKHYNTSDNKTLYNSIFYDHFRYYQLQMKCLMELHRLLNSEDMPSYNTLCSLISQCVTLVKNPDFSTMLRLEYANYDDCDKYTRYFSPYPVIQYMYYNDNKDCTDYAFPDSDMRKFLTEIITDYPTYTESFLANHRKQIIDLAKYIFSDVLSFELREICPVINFNNSEIETDWYFPSLVNALFFSLYWDHSSLQVIAKCANSKCNRLFVHSGAYSTRKYCCPECAHRTANRKYKRKISKKVAQN